MRIIVLSIGCTLCELGLKVPLIPILLPVQTGATVVDSVLDAVSKITGLSIDAITPIIESLALAETTIDSVIFQLCQLLNSC